MTNLTMMIPMLRPIQRCVSVLIIILEIKAKKEIKGYTGAATSSAVGTARPLSVVTASSGSIGGGGGGQSSVGPIGSNLMDMIRILKDSDDEDSDEDLFA